MADEHQTEELDQTQQAIVEGAVRAALKFGFRNLTTKRIAEEAGVNEVTIFRRFGSKAAVLAALFKHEAHSISTKAIFYTGDLEADLTRIVDTLAQAIKKRETIIPVILLELPQNPELRQFAQYSMKTVHDFMEILQRYQTEGKLKTGPVQIQFFSLVGPLVFSNTLAGLFPADDSVDQAKEYVMRYLDGHRAA